MIDLAFDEMSLNLIKRKIRRVSETPAALPQTNYSKRKREIQESPALVVGLSRRHEKIGCRSELLVVAPSVWNYNCALERPKISYLGLTNNNAVYFGSKCASRQFKTTDATSNNSRDFTPDFIGGETQSSTSSGSYKEKH